MELGPLPGRGPRILLAEDDFEMRSFLASVLRTAGYEVIEASSGLRLLEQMSLSLVYNVKFDLDLVISDIRMPGASGLEV
jgi:two-component system response regulator (stage 0 sporulation protein F)